MDYDFSGYATRNNMKCSDGRTILKDAFKDNDQTQVPLVWNHDHNNAENILGHAMLENRNDGVYAYCSFNDTTSGELAKTLVKHGDITAMSIYANQLKQNGGDVVHGIIREVSLVYSGANPGAYIDNILTHSDVDDEAIIYTGENFELYHSEELSHVDKGDDDDGETVEDVFNTLTEKQKKVVLALIGLAAKGDDNDEDEDEGGEEMKHNVFEGEGTEETTLTHADMQKILGDAKRLGSLKAAVDENIENGFLAHAIDTTGMETATGTQNYGFNDPSMLFPDYRNLNNPPEWISREMSWVRKVIGGVHHTPFSRIKSTYANITEDDARALGYIKGKLKKEEVFTTLKRTTDPQTIYKKQKLDRDDIIDITDFDVVAWIRSEMRVMLDEEIARAILIGDGRNPSSDDKIQELHVRPIVKDDPLFNTKVDVASSTAQTLDKLDDDTAKEIIKSAIRARKDYKGSGNPTFFTTEDVLTALLLLEDGIGHRLYKTEAELATAMRVNDIVTVEVMENYSIDSKPLIGVIVNMKDYNVGADKGGEINMFDDFDIDYNQQKYLIETRISGALVKPYSALTLLLNYGA